MSGSCLFIQMTVIMDKELTLYQAHQIADKIENHLHTHFSDCEIILHLEPDSKIIPSNK
jgi:divalent metal cation (Fe/Co/Zn/Cd) transporter